MLEVSGFSCGYSGSCGGTLSGFQRVARSRGEPEPTSVTGRPGAGRAGQLRSYRVRVKRLSDGLEIERSTGPGYHSKKAWKSRREAVQREILRELGWRG